MKHFPNPLTALLAFAWLAAASMPAHGQAPVISSFGQNGQLVCTNLQPGSTASVEWASSVLGPWTNNWAGLDAVTADSNGAMRVSVPMFYRVRGVAQGTNTVPAGMAFIPAGSFTMGNTFSGEGDSDEVPTHTVYVSAFYLDRTEVTKALWDDVYNWAITHGYSFDNGGLGKAATHPVQTVSWFDCVKWCNARSEKEGKTPAYYMDAGLSMRYRAAAMNPYVNWSSGYRLPTEAEWEKAARGGASGHRFPWSDTDNITHSRANYSSSTSYAYDTSSTRGYHPTFNDGFYPYTSPVGYFAANGYGLYDMAGNVFEWCWDWYDGAYPSGSQTDPRGPTTGSYRVFRGGSWNDLAFICRSAYRVNNYPDYRYRSIGFRVVLASGQP